MTIVGVAPVRSCSEIGPCSAAALKSSVLANVSKTVSHKKYNCDSSRGVPSLYSCLLAEDCRVAPSPTESKRSTNACRHSEAETN